MTKTVMALVPHPDDAEWYAGGVLAQFNQTEQAKIVIVIATDGRVGSLNIPSEELVQIRHEEALQAARFFDAQVIFLDYPDFQLDQLPVGVLRERFIRLIRTFQPDVVIAEDAFAGYDPHPDHRAIATAALEAIEYAALPLLHPEHLAEGLKAHFTAEKYYYSESGLGANRIVDIGATFETKIQALMAHKSQVEFLVQGVLQQITHAGLESQSAFDITPEQAIRLALSSQAAAAGQQIGVAYAEAFRYERYHSLIEAALQNQ